MKILYFDCAMGAAGDMLTAALLGLVDDKEKVLHELNHAGIPDVRYSALPSVKCGITGLHVSVSFNGQEEQVEDVNLMHEHVHAHEHVHEHGHSHGATPARISEVIDGLKLPEQVKADAKAVYELIADAESRVHGKPVSEIHFHEVGTYDAIADVVAVCYLIHEIGAEEIKVSPIHVGSGSVRCAHGILPVPAPATALILQGMPVYGGAVKGELCTPTGAALLKYFATPVSGMPAMAIERIGYGCGKKDFEAANVVRVISGESAKTDGAAGDSGQEVPVSGEGALMDEIWELNCNIDDQSAEEIAWAMEKLMDSGALDVFAMPVTMKKSRPGVLLTVLVRPADKDRLMELIFKYTTTIGIREARKVRSVLKRTIRVEDTAFGQVRIKKSEGYGVSGQKYEFEDLARIASERNLSIREVRRQLDEMRLLGGRNE